MKRRLAIIATSATLAFTSCSKERIHGQGPVITETRNISGFTSVFSNGSNNVHISQGAIFKVEVRGYSNLLPYYETRVVNNTLYLAYKQNVNIKNDNAEVFITMPALSGLQLAGSGNITTSGSFTGYTNFNAGISGSGNINFSSGSTQNFYAVITGSGNIYTLNLNAAEAEAIITGSGNTEITASARLNVKITGSGNVYYRGNPVITTNITGSGSVIPK